MSSVNKVILVGNVGKDPEIRYTQAGDPIASFSLATSEKWTGKDGQKQERTEWHQVTVFGKTAKVVGDYVTKGSKLYIEGTIKYEEYTDKEEIKRRVTKIQVNQFGGRLVMLGSRNGSGSKRRDEDDDGDKQYNEGDDTVPF